MMVKTFRRSNIETTNRKTHSENVENITGYIAEKLDLNVPVVKLIAKHHDIGHTFLGHSGEWWLSEIKKDLGLGCYVHNALGTRDLIYTYNVKGKIREEIARQYIGDEKAIDPEIDKVVDDLWIIFDGINGHNGELSESTYHPNVEKTEKDFEEELLNCYVIEGFDKTIIPATTEASLMRLCDKISYIPYDMVDGLREGMIKELDEEYMKTLIPILMHDTEFKKEEEIRSYIEKCVIKENYEELAQRLQSIFKHDVIKNSNIQHNSEDTISMSKEMSILMHRLRDINNKQIVNFVLMQEDHEVYPKVLRELVEKFSEIITKEGILERLNGSENDIELSKKLKQKYENTPYIGFVKYISNISEEDFKWTKNMIKVAREKAIDDEIDEGIKHALENEKVKNVKGQDNRVRRIRFFKYSFKEIAKKDAYNEDGEESKIDEVKKVLKSKCIPKDFYTNADESLIIEFATKYLATLSDKELMLLAIETGKIDREQARSLTRTYNKIDLQEEYMTHKQWDETSKAQSQATSGQENRKIGNDR